MTDDLSKEILTEIEKDKVRAFADDKLMFDAVKKYVLAVVYKHGVFEKGKPFDGTVNWALQFAGQAINNASVPRSDEELGQNLRALTSATSLVESGFKELAELKEVETEEVSETNPAE